MAEWLLLPLVPAQPGDVAASGLGVSRGNAGMEHRGIMDGVQLFEPAGVEQCCNDNDRGLWLSQPHNTGRA